MHRPSSIAAPPVPPEGPLLLLSPHIDDAALSCAALLARPEPLDVMVVLAGEPSPPRTGTWDRTTGFADSRESIAARRAEEEAAFAGSRHRRLYLSLLDGQYIAPPRPATDAAALAAAIAAWLDRHGAATVALPAGAGRPPLPAGAGRPPAPGGPSRRPAPRRTRARVERLVSARLGPEPHADHLFVRDAALEALRERDDAGVLLYEELPYRRGAPADSQVAASAAGWGATPARAVVAVDRRAKAARIAAYVSQLPHLSDEGTRLDDPQSLPPDERYWWLVRRR